ncbi:MAG: ABC transporter substrate-binding protein [Cytophagales bacterium]
MYKLLTRFCNILIIICLYSCSAKKDSKSYKIFRYNQNDGLTTLDPAFAKDMPNMFATNQLYNGLVELDKQMKVTGSLAESWEISEDGKMYTFHLKKDIKFHDSEVFEGNKGRILEASDVVFSFKRIIDTLTASPGAWIFNDKVLRDTQGKFSDTCFKAIDSQTVRIYLAKPFPPFLQLLAMPYGFVIPHEAIEKYGKEFRIHPVGTGPFQFKLWEENNALILNKNPNYWKKDSSGLQLPYLDIVHVSFIGDRNVAFMTFRQKKFDFISGLDENSRDIIFNYDGSIKKEFSDKYDVQKIPYLNTEYFSINVDASTYEDKNHPLLNKKVRQALNYAINKEQMVQFILNNVGQPGNSGFVPPILYPNAQSILGFKYDQQKALNLLKEAGYSKDKSVKGLKLYTVARFPYKEIAEFIQREWAKLGIKTEIEINPFATHLQLSSNSKLPMFRSSWQGDYPDPENYLTLFYSPSFSPGGPNRTHFKNEKFDQLYEQAQLEQDPEKRNAIYKQMDAIVIEEAPVIVLWYDEVVRLTQKNVKGLGANAMNNLVLEKVDIVKE